MTHTIILTYLGFLGMILLLVASFVLGTIFFTQGNNIAGLSFMSPSIILTAVAIFNPSVISAIRGNKKDKSE
jgi:flagellar biosynthesis protein FliP